MTLSKRTIEKKSSYPFESQLITFVKNTHPESQHPPVSTHVQRFVAMPKVAMHQRISWWSKTQQVGKYYLDDCNLFEPQASFAFLPEFIFPSLRPLKQSTRNNQYSPTATTPKGLWRCRK